VHLRHPGRIDAALDEVNQLHRTWQGSWSRTDWLLVKDECLRRIDYTYDRLREHFGDQVADVVDSRLYWEIHRLTSESQRPWDLFRRQAETQAAYLARLAEKLTAHKKFAAQPGHIVVPDTLAFTHAHPFEQFNWPIELDLRPDVRLVVPILVVEELDKVKSFDRGQDRHRARQALKELADRLGSDPQRPARVRDHVTVEILIDDDWHERMPINSTTRRSSTKPARSRIGLEGT
jgi:PIN domain